jgi:hypothetical protein
MSVAYYWVTPKQWSHPNSLLVYLPSEFGSLPPVTAKVKRPDTASFSASVIHGLSLGIGTGLSFIIEVDGAAA